MGMSSENRYDQVVGIILETLETMKGENDLLEDVPIHGDISLIGRDTIIDSRSLVELLLTVEEYVEEEYGKTFDWSSDRAMSRQNSPFRTPAILARFVLEESGL